MRRRDVFRLLAGAMIAAPYRVAAQTAAKTYRMAMLTSGPAFPADSPIVMLLMGALADHGYKLGQNLDFQSYGADGQLARLPQWHGMLPQARSMPCSSSAGRRPPQ
jgi:hypothetical protein